MNEDDEDYDDDYESCTKKRLPAIFAWFLLLTTSAVYFILVLPNLHVVIGTDQLYFIILCSIHGCIFIYVIINYLTASLLDPGRFPKVNEYEKHVKVENLNNLTHKTVSINDISVRMKWCTTCKFFRPPRCSHCALCDYCIENMDHHCPWYLLIFSPIYLSANAFMLSNCVGKRNYKYFFQFLISLSTHMIIIFTFCLLYVLWNKDNLADTPVIASLILIVLVCILFIPVGGLAGFHLVLVSRGRTTNEQVTGKFRSGVNPFDMGFFMNWKRAICSPATPNLISYSRRCAELKEKTIKKLKYTNKKSIKAGQQTNGHVSNDVRPNGVSKEKIYKSKTYAAQYTGKSDHVKLNEIVVNENNRNNNVWIDRNTANEHELNRLLKNSTVPGNGSNGNGQSIRNDSYYNANRQYQQQQSQKNNAVKQQQHQKISILSGKTKQPNNKQPKQQQKDDNASYEITV